MKITRIFHFLLIALLMLSTSVFLAGCDDDPPAIDPPKNEIQLTLNHQWDGSDLGLNKWYVTANQDSFQLTKIIYHINNFEFIDANGKSYPADNIWFMVSGEESLKPMFTMGDLNDVEFVSMRFKVGVADSMANAVGALNSVFTEPMYWGMNNGYINFKLEGKTSKVGNQGVVLHVGGYLNNVKAWANVEVDFGLDKIVSSKIGLNKLTLNVNLADYFQNPNLIDLKVINEIHAPGDDAVTIAQNWPSMFSFSKVE